MDDVNDSMVLRPKLSPVIDFGQMPIANAFLSESEFDSIKKGLKWEYSYNMVLGFDPETHAIGLVNTVPQEMMFHDHYAFFSSTSKGMQKHFFETAQALKPYVGSGVVVEIGSNDGIMLEAWKELGIPAVGVEPSANVARTSRERGHNVINAFMNMATVHAILESYGVQKRGIYLVFAANVSCHIEELGAYLSCISQLIGKHGIFVCEDPYFLDIVQKTSYDQIYDEHVWYFTISFMNTMLESLGLHVFHCEHIDVHGGELRMYIGHRDTHKETPAVAEWRARETDIELKLLLLERNIKASREKLRDILYGLKKSGKTLCGFGASSKGVIVANYCGITPELIPYVTDNTPAKQGMYYPGMHIPVIPQEEFKKRNPDYALLFVWNHLKEIQKYQKWFEEGGGKWITHVPNPRII
ncbi:MAG: methyltransferase domain-containing protein [Patescibacteria group bacterium]